MLTALRMALVVVTCLGLADGQTSSSEKRLSLEEVVKLAESGFSDDLMITKIRKNGKAFDLSAGELVDLKKAGLSDNVIRYLLDPSQPYSPQPPPSVLASATPQPTAPARAPSTPAKKYALDAGAARIPTDPGFYALTGEQVVSSDLKLLLGEQKGKTLIMKKGKTIAYLVGAGAKARMKSVRAMYVRLPESREVQELVLVSMASKNGRRELEMGGSDGKQLKAEATRPFDSLEVGPRLYRLSPGELSAGEYLFLFLGSADPPKAVYGKGYDFGISEGSKRK